MFFSNTNKSTKILFAKIKYINENHKRKIEKINEDFVRKKYINR
jgi:hypothetical protein